MSTGTAYQHVPVCLMLTCAHPTLLNLNDLEKVPRDKSWREMSRYFARVAMWYTRGGFVDEHGVRHESDYHYNESRILWEVWNEVQSNREHGMSPTDYIAMYDAQVAALTVDLDASIAPGGAWRGTIGGPSLAGKCNHPPTHPLTHARTHTHAHAHARTHTHISIRACL